MRILVVEDDVNLSRQLSEALKDPSPNLPLLRALQDDPSAYVRRSVANHLNDIAKDHPDLVAEWIREHRREASAERTESINGSSSWPAAKACVGAPSQAAGATVSAPKDVRQERREMPGALMRIGAP